MEKGKVHACMTENEKSLFLVTCVLLKLDDTFENWPIQSNHYDHNNEAPSLFRNICGVKALVGIRQTGLNCMTLLTAEFCAYDHDSPLEMC